MLALASEGAAAMLQRLRMNWIMRRIFVNVNSAARNKFENVQKPGFFNPGFVGFFSLKSGCQPFP
jgi:hypothetical protein